MKKDKAHIIRKTLIVIVLILVVATSGLFAIKTQIKQVTLNYYGSVQNLNTVAGTVDSFLIQNKIYVGDNMVVEPSRDTKLIDGMKITIYSKQELAKLDYTEVFGKDYSPMVAKVVEVFEDIPFGEQKKDNPKVDRGTENVVQEGKNGTKSTKFLVKYQNNQEVYRKEMSTVVVAEAQDKIIEVGTKINPVSSRSAVVKSINAIPVDAGFRKYNIALSEDLQKYAYNLCKQYGLDYELFLAVMYKESGYNQYALGGGNSYGLCQIHVSNHSNLRSKLGVSNFFDPYDNMTAGAYLLAHYFTAARNRVSGDAVTVYALNSYNMGEGAYFNNCYSKGILNRSYSTSVLNLRNSLITNGGL